MKKEKTPESVPKKVRETIFSNWKSKLQK